MKILVVLPRFPYPLDKGDKLRAYHQIVELSKRHEIHLFCVSHSRVAEENIKALRPFCRQIRVVRLNPLVCYINILCNWFSSKSLQMGYWNTSRSKRLCRRFATEVQPDVVYNQMVRTMPLAARLPFPKVMDFQDALSMNTERRMEQTTGFWHYVLHYEFKMLRSSEYNAFSFFDGLTIISETDSEAIPHKKNGEIRIVTNGVDTEYFNTKHLTLNTKHLTLNTKHLTLNTKHLTLNTKHLTLNTKHLTLNTKHLTLNTKHLTLNTKHSLCFCGNMSYAPNVDAARFLVKEVMPLVWEQCPEATVLLAGTDPRSSVRALASDRVTVSGHLPDIRDAYASSQVFVAPMRIGSGLQNKLLEAMAMQKPCVTTSLANAALGATSGDQLFVGDSKEDLAYWICLLLGSEDVRTRIAEEGNRFVQQHYSWPAAVKPLEELLDAVVAK